MAWAPDYASSADLKAFLRVADSVDDAQVALAVTASSRVIDKACGRQFGVLASATEWTYTAVWNRHRGRWVVPIDDVATTTGMVVKVDGETVTDYTLEPRQGVAKGKVWVLLVLGETVVCSGGRDGVAMTALWGWPSVPSAIKQACLLQSSRFLARRDSPFGIAGSPDSGGELRLLASLDPDVRVSIRPYVRLAGAA